MASRFRFGLRLLFVAIALFALLTWAAVRLHEWYNSTPLADAIASFNATAASDPIGKHEPPLTEDEIVASIQAQLSTLPDADSRVKGIYDRIARTRRLPRGGSLHSIPGYSDGTNSFRVWWINLEIMTSDTGGYGLRVRHTNDPVAAAQDNRPPGLEPPPGP
jgi:hypothetical protein